MAAHRAMKAGPAPRPEHRDDHHPRARDQRRRRGPAEVRADAIERAVIYAMAVRIDGDRSKALLAMQDEYRDRLVGRVEHAVEPISRTTCPRARKMAIAPRPIDPSPRNVASPSTTWRRASSSAAVLFRSQSAPTSNRIAMAQGSRNGSAHATTSAPRRHPRGVPLHLEHRPQGVGAGDAVVPEAVRAGRGALGDDETRVLCALGAVLRHQIVGHVPDRTRAGLGDITARSMRATSPRVKGERSCGIFMAPATGHGCPA